jgi:hypothetical protein
VEVHVAKVGNDIVGATWVEDEIMFYLDGGTNERWAVMSEDFRPKTTHRSLRSSAGQGGARIRGKSAMIAAGYTTAMDGIHAREFSIALMKLCGPEFQAALDKVMADAVTKGQAVK